MNAGLQDAFSVYAFQYRQALGASSSALGAGSLTHADRSLVR